MPQAKQLFATLKRQLKAKGLRYSDVAAHLNLSEASVKRVFAEQSFSVQRLEDICRLLDMEISDLVKLMEREQDRVVQLSIEQEEEIASDLLLLLVTACVINGFTYADLLEQFNIKASDCIKRLTTLDRLKIIELLPNNRIKLRVGADFKWRANGPIQQFFQEKVEQEFFNSKFEHDNEKLLVLNGMLSRESNFDFQKKMQHLAREFTALAQQDFALPMDKKQGATVVLAIRDWRYELFKQFRKD